MSVAQNGTVIFTLVVSGFTYYTFWTLILPFVDSGHVLHSLFPPLHYAILVPTVAGVFMLCVVLAFLGAVLLRSSLHAQRPRLRPL